MSNEVKQGRYHVAVLPADIACGKRGDADGCPIALALKRTLGIDEIEVDGHRLRLGEFSEYDGIVEKDKRDTVDAFIACFDDGIDPEPFDFDLTVEPREYGGD